MKIKISAAVFLLAMFFGCEDDNLVAITDKPVAADLFAKYESVFNATTGTALFWNENRSQRIIFHSNAKLLFEGYKMDYRSSDYTYIKALEGFYSTSTFDITDVNNKQFVNSITMNSVELPANIRNNDTIDTSQPLQVAWLTINGYSGIPLQDKETITLRIETISVTQNVNDSRTITFTDSAFTELRKLKLDPAQTVTMAIERNKTIDLQNSFGSGSGKISSQYIGVPRNMYLKY